MPRVFSPAVTEMVGLVDRCGSWTLNLGVESNLESDSVDHCCNLFVLAVNRSEIGQKEDIAATGVRTQATLVSRDHVFK